MNRIKLFFKRVLKDTLPYAASLRVFPPPPITEWVPPIIYNEFRERVLIAYLQDVHIRHSPYGFVSGRVPKRILWDHYNRELNTQFYSHKDIFKIKFDDSGKRKFGLLIEPENVVADDYRKVLTANDEVRQLDALFTHSEKFLDKYDNACYIPASGVWYGTELHGGEMKDNGYDLKTKILSMVCSTKTLSREQVFRKSLALEILRQNKGEVMGRVVGKYVNNLGEIYQNYMYNVAIENTRGKFYFTEKILNCFASMTIPIYYGASDIGDFFNEDGIIVIKQPSIECAMETINKFCSREDYESRKEAVIDNYNRVKHYLCIEDYMCDHYMDKFKY